MAKDKYEISLWEDYLVAQEWRVVDTENQEFDSKQTYYARSSTTPYTYTKIENMTGYESGVTYYLDIPSHYEEQKLCVIGSDSLTALCKTYDPKLVENINGTNTFTFSMYYTYVDEYGEKQTNPFLNLLANERKVKVYWKSKWYDFIIKSCQEDSSKKSITYTCKDLFINELSKNGFNLEFDTELDNNQGSVTELASAVLAESDWQLASDNDTIQQTEEEPVYEVNVLNNFTANDDTLGSSHSVEISSTRASGDTTKILVFYSVKQNKPLYCQFLYGPSNTYPRDTNSQLVIDTDCYSVTIDSWNETSSTLTAVKDGKNLFTINLSGNVSENYRGSRLVRKQKSILDPLTDKYCDIFTATAASTGKYNIGDKIYRYSSTDYKDPTYVNNLVVNSSDFASTEGWIGDNLIFTLYPLLTSSVTSLDEYSAQSFLRFKNTNSSVDYFLNRGLQESLSYVPDGFRFNEEYIFRIKARTNSSDLPTDTYVDNTVVLRPKICKYNTSFEPTGDDYFTLGTPSYSSTSHWIEFPLTCNKSVTQSQITSDSIGLFIQVAASSTYWIEDVEFFPLIYGKDINENTVRINPGDMNVQSIVTVNYTYYNHTTYASAVSADEIEPLYYGSTEWSNSDLSPDYNTNFEKIRSISAKNSNRFNLLQSLAETFECWCKFTIDHDSTGKIKYYDSQGYYQPQKFISFVSEVGEETGIGFIYGIDLKSVQRTIQSDQIVTKTIVSANSNEFATNGFCTIARSKENYARDTFLLNFDYYINQGLVSSGEINKDLYLTTSDAIGYYYYLNQYNTELDSIADELTAKKSELEKQESYQTVYSNLVTSATQNKLELEADITKKANQSSYATAVEYVRQYGTDELKAELLAHENAKANLASYTSIANNLNTSVTLLKEKIEALETRQETLISLSKALHLKFYKKYSRFIQEGSWKSDEYIDDDLYYLDAKSVAYTSSRPQISYNISVIRLSAIDEYKNKVFHLGDISYVQDTEFFGYTYINQIKTPYKEKVLVSEITSNFDDPSKDSFKVQNYKTQFEDLFQRITSTTQSLQYASGEYARAASIVETNGTINAETLQSSIATNNQLVFATQNDEIIQDSTGLTVSDATDPSKKTKLTSGGLFISTDGGSTWKNAVRGEGIATQYLTSGSINSNQITILDGSFKTFRWDSNGITAFDQDDTVGVNLSKFVRFDHYGVYGINNSSGETYTPTSEDDIWNDAQFGLTWKGFFIKNKYTGHYVEVSSENDIQIVDTTGTAEVARVKIGELDTNNYGFRIADTTGAAVLEAGSDGELWLKQQLHISSTEDGYDIQIGYLDDYRTASSTQIHQVFNANDAFIVYEDGYIKATGGKIGNMTIQEVEDSVYRVEIQSDSGIIFKNGSGSKILTAKLFKGTTEVTDGTFAYVWKKNNVILSTTTKSITVTADSTNATYIYTCDITYTPAS